MSVVALHSRCGGLLRLSYSTPGYPSEGPACPDVALCCDHSNSKASASSMSTDSAYGHAQPESLRGKGKSLISSSSNGSLPAVVGGKLSSIPEPPAPLAKGKSALLVGLKSVFRWA